MARQQRQFPHGKYILRSQQQRSLLRNSRGSIARQSAPTWKAMKLLSSAELRTYLQTSQRKQSLVHVGMLFRNVIYVKVWLSQTYNGISVTDLWDTYTLWISRGGSEASTIIARKRGFRGTWTSTTFGSIGEHPRTQSSMCSFVEWCFTNQNA